MWLDTRGGPTTTLNTIVHESVHVFQHAAKYAEEDVIGKELEAYAIADIVMNMVAEHARQTNPKEPNAVHQEGRDS